jgi:pimeloyl-ACP methyl ester carboxylesterase
VVKERLNPFDLRAAKEEIPKRRSISPKPRNTPHLISPEHHLGADSDTATSRLFRTFATRSVLRVSRLCRSSGTVLQFFSFAAILTCLGCTHFHRAAENPYGHYSGVYALDENTSAIVRPDHDRLMVKVTGQDYFEVFPQEGDSFFYKIVDAQLTFRRSETGTVTGFILHQDGKNYTFSRRSEVVPKDFTRMVSLGDYRVRVMVRGQGALPVVFEGGLGESLDAWDKVSSEVANFTRVVAYDRSGLGLSGRTTSPRTAENVAKDLRKVLRKAGVSGPFVFAGNSAGALFLRVYAHCYPGDVAALVLVEPSSEQYEDWLRRAHPEAFESGSDELEHSAIGFRDHAAAWSRSLEQAREAWPLPSVPVIILTGMRHDARDKDKRELWLQSHRGLVERIPGAKHVVSAKSGHGLVSNEPELVIREVREVFDRVESKVLP